MSESDSNKDRIDESYKLDFLYEWAVWGHLSSKKDIELILLKGHLLLENALETTLSRNNILENQNYSFYKKITLLENRILIKTLDEQLIFNSLKKINLMRNKLAHEFFYKELDNDLEDWSKDILANLKGTKYSNFTFKTKIVHSFSILAFNLLKIKNYR